MKLNLFNIFSKPQKHSGDPYPDLKLDLKKISKQREIPVIQPDLPLRKNKVKRTSSLSNVRETFNKLKRSSSLNKRNRKHKISYTHNRKIKVSNYPEDLNPNIPEEDHSGDTSIFDQVRTSSPIFSSFINITPDNQDYTDYYENLYSHYCQDTSESNNDTSSAITSLDWNKENIPPFNYPLSASKTPNFSITPRTPKLSQNSQFNDTENPFLDTNILTPPHRQFLNDTEQDFFQFENDREILYYTSHTSLSCKSTPPNCLKEKPSFLRSSASPRIKLPELPQCNTRIPISAKSINLLNTFSVLANENNISEIDFEEKSLLEALSSTELISCSHVKFVTYNS